MLLAGLAFGPVLGTVYALVWATLACSPRPVPGRGAVAFWVGADERLRHLDEGVGGRAGGRWSRFTPAVEGFYKWICSKVDLL